MSGAQPDTERPGDTHSSIAVVGALRGFLGCNIRACGAGAGRAGEDEIEKAFDADDDMRDALEKLVVATVAAKVQLTADMEEAAAKQQVEELKSLTRPALKARALTEGVAQKVIDAADDAEDKRGKLTALVLEAMRTKASTLATSEAAKAKATKAARDALCKLRYSKLKERALKDGVTQADMDKADEVDEPSPGLIEMIMAARQAKEEKETAEKEAEAAKKAAEVEKAGGGATPWAAMLAKLPGCGSKAAEGDKGKGDKGKGDKGKGDKDKGKGKDKPAKAKGK